MLLKIDAKGRILIPAYIRKKMGLKRIVRMRVEKNRLIIESVEDPVEVLVRTVVKGSRDVEKEITNFRKMAEKEAMKRVREKWL